MYLMIVVSMSFLLAFWGGQVWRQADHFLNLLLFYRHEQEMSMFIESLLKFGIARFYNEPGDFFINHASHEFKYQWPPEGNFGFSGVLKYSKQEDGSCLLEAMLLKEHEVVAQRIIMLGERDRKS